MEQHGQASTSSPPSVLRTAAWRAIWGALRCNQVYAARHARLTMRDIGCLTKGQASAALPAAEDELRHGPYLMHRLGHDQNTLRIGLICVAEHVTTAVLLNAPNGGSARILLAVVC
jgi:hypothetical protein